MRTDEQFVSLVCVADVFSNSIITGGAQSTKGLKTTNNSVMFEQLRGKRQKQLIASSQVHLRQRAVQVSIIIKTLCD